MHRWVVFEIEFQTLYGHGIESDVVELRKADFHNPVCFWWYQTVTSRHNCFNVCSKYKFFVCTNSFNIFLLNCLQSWKEINFLHILVCDGDDDDDCVLMFYLPWLRSWQLQQRHFITFRSSHCHSLKLKYFLTLEARADIWCSINEVSLRCGLANDLTRISN